MKALEVIVDVVKGRRSLKSLVVPPQAHGPRVEHEAALRAQEHINECIMRDIERGHHYAASHQPAQAIPAKMSPKDAIRYARATRRRSIKHEPEFKEKP